MVLLNTSLYAVWFIIFKLLADSGQGYITFDGEGVGDFAC